MALAAMIIPSSTAWGSASSTLRSMKAPGSPSSALQSTYLTSPGVFCANSHFRPAGNPAPPRPRRPEILTSSTICWGVSSSSALAAPKYPSRAMYSSMTSGSIAPLLRMTQKLWCLKNGMASILGMDSGGAGAA